MFLKGLLAGTVLGSVSANSYDWSMGNITLYHSQNTYCDPDNYENRTYKDVLAGFIPTYTIYNGDHDVHGYVGYHSGQESIYVAFRGSESIQNWVDNLDAILTDYPLCDGCRVHKGFYNAEQSCYNEVLSAVKSLQATYSSYDVMVTGHSLGGAIATLTSMDLINSGINNVRLWNYGCPRIGDTDFANYANSFISDHHRVTHHKDMVPHVPMHERFTHMDGEWYQPSDDLVIQECFGNEDKDCSYQWHLTSIQDHLYYLGLDLGASDEKCEAFV
mmetsp:Transcript_15226/g.28672  ORF Transcript_15226/g.28672 Transcript_15226/m.28672 type:complete len:274 (-) Transcript_15226:324-1145(-)